MELRKCYIPKLIAMTRDRITALWDAMYYDTQARELFLSQHVELETELTLSDHECYYEQLLERVCNVLLL